MCLAAALSNPIPERIAAPATVSPQLAGIPLAEIKPMSPDFVWPVLERTNMKMPRSKFAESPVNDSLHFS